jgi:2-polyprenyl-3-methyl-5-hydroxy-6-metoxy-1,4-benzoquinol methylase
MNNEVRLSGAMFEQITRALVCPTHRLPLTFPATFSGEGGVPWPDAEILCSHGCRFNVQGGIPRFVGEDTYASSFGVQWNRYPRTELDSFTGRTYSQQRLERCLGAPLKSLRGKDILECGSGAGRFTELLLQNCRTLTCIDLSAAVDANLRNCRPLSPYLLMQGDINASPLPKSFFDVVICLGVIQHTSNPEQTIASLASHVKRGGYLVIDHYTRDRGSKAGNLLSCFDYFDMAYVAREILRHMDPKRSIRLTKILTALCDPIRKHSCKMPAVDRFVRRLLPTACYYNKFPDLDPRIVYEMNELDTCDWLTDYHKFFRSPAQIRATLEQLGLEVKICALGGNGVEALARVPLAPTEAMQAVLVHA